jgi:PAS domain S-box-containing protein/putative nucleotidyltransferase with HDIG domain
MKKKVLIVDDNSTNIYMLESMLKGYGLEVTSAQNGKDALDKAHLTPPDLLVTDILMPVMDGYALCRQWKSDDTLKHIPLVFYTAEYTGSVNEEFALSLGADRFILKPQEPDVLMDMLNGVLEEKYGARQVATKPLGEEMEFFRQHNEILYQKLEKKMLDLETANQELTILEEKYRESEELFRSYLEYAPDGVYMSDLEGSFLYGNRKCEEMIGYRREELIGKNFLELNLLSENSRDKAVELLQANREGRSTGPDEIDLIGKDGHLIPIEINTNVVQRRGQRTVLSFVRDIAERRRAKETLERERTLLRSLIDNVPDRIYAKDTEGRFIICNEAMVRRMGKTGMAEIVGKSDFDFLPPEMAKQFRADEQAILQTGIPMINREEALAVEGGTITRWNLATKVPLLDRQGNRIGIVGVGREITDRKQAEQKLKDTLESLRKAFGTTVQVMVSAVEIRDPYTAGHQLRVADLARAIAKEKGLTPDRIDGLRMAALIHDIGKLSIPAEILSKPTRLTEIEFSLIKEHSLKGYEMLKDVESPWPLAQIVYQHHERMNGSGYPRNLQGEEILLEARILAVADVVESMANHRPYRPSLGVHAALDEIAKNRGLLYDAEVVDACLKIFNEKGYRMAA